MIYFMTASKDATIYLQQPNQNTGLDNILEVSKVYYGTVKDISRSLLKFDTTHLSASISSGAVTMSAATLILRETQSEELPLDYTITAYPVSQSWEMGNGQRYDAISTQGTTWYYREGDSKQPWLSGSFTTQSTGSANGYGGVWYTTPNTSQIFSYQSADIQMDMLPLMNAWVTGSMPNDGFILKHSSTAEENTVDYGILKFFSKETHTIYQPKIQIAWDDQRYNTGSLTVLSTTDIKIGVTNLKSEYHVGTTPVLKVFGRELYPLKTYGTTFEYDTVSALPIETYYQVRDYINDEIIVPFSDYSKVSCGVSGSYFKLNLSNWEVGLTYKIEFMTVIDDDTIYVDNNLTFKLI